ncbi:MAG: alpha/beta hydrolase [Gemmatimonadota bacterium]|nr:alpha/beta hydrolase [Gemmatimonadota bacterium]
MRVPRPSLAAVILAAFAGCADSMPTSPLTRPDLTPLGSAASVAEPATGPWARIVQGETGPGSLYAIYIPRADKMNGDAVFYAHGFRDVDLGDVPGTIDLRNQDDFYAIRDKLGEMGYTVAYSSFSENGFAVKDGAQRTHQLRGLVAAELGGSPARSFLVGHSLGGAIGLDLAERYPDQYDGALLMCGMVGGSLVQTQYVGNVRALFDFFFPDAGMPGTVLTPPGRAITPLEVQAFFQARLTSTTPGVPQATAAALLAIASTKEAPLPYVPAAMIGTLVGSVAGALNFHSRGIQNLLDLTNGHSPFDNTAGYSLGTALFGGAQSLIDAANHPETGVPRYSMDPSAANYLERHFTPSGNLRIPVLALHNAWDPGVPAFHVAALRAAAERAGATENLLPRVIPFRGSLRHCDINQADAVPAFQALVGWATTGNKPAN